MRIDVGRVPDQWRAIEEISALLLQICICRVRLDFHRCAGRHKDVIPLIRRLERVTRPRCCASGTVDWRSRHDNQIALAERKARRHSSRRGARRSARLYRSQIGRPRANRAHRCKRRRQGPYAVLLQAGLRDQVNQHYRSTFGASAAVGLITGFAQYLGTAAFSHGGDRPVIIAGIEYGSTLNTMNTWPTVRTTSTTMATKCQ